MTPLQEIGVNAAGSLVAASLIALMAFAFNCWRNYKLETLLKVGISEHGMGYNQDDFHVIFENKTAVSIRVRAILLVDKHVGFLELKFRRPVSQASLLNVLAQRTGPEKISIRAHFPFSSEHSDAHLLLPYTGGVWGALKTEIHSRKWDIEKCWVIVEYPTLFGGSALLKVDFSDAATNLVRKVLSEITKTIPLSEPTDH